MKKLITLLLIAAMLLPAASLADLPDISDLTTDELIELNHQIQARLFSEQLVSGVTVPPGRYTIGEDIPAGTYRIEITGGTGFFDVYDKEGGRNTMTGLTGELYSVTEIGKIEFVDGNILALYNSTFIFFPYAGLFD